MKAATDIREVREITTCYMFCQYHHYYLNRLFFYKTRIVSTPTYLLATTTRGHGGALVETTLFDRMVVGSNPALAAM